MKQSKRKKTSYNPNLGFIGNSEVKVSNYLFTKRKLRTAYQHAKPIAERLLKEEVANHYSESKKLTKFLKNRDLTFSKKTSSGEYKTFTVPCTTTIVPLQKSLFNDVEKAAQKLVISLRAVIQDIYGSKDLRSSKFVQSLPIAVRDIFINAIETSPNYFPQLHHPNMKKYPFFDNVGLDLVLVEDYMAKSEQFPHLIAKNMKDEIPGLPFRILEINAGSPSGASNNMNVLEGIYEQSPEILDSLGRVMPNDHFKILGETYKSLGEYWTGNKNGVQILLPPGGGNGAAPEIHQLAAYSGLLYTDSDQLYQDNEGNIRLRTVSKNNPIVTAIYSRINADSALFDVEKNLLMRNPDSGQPLYLRDNLIKDEDDKGRIILDEKGQPIPQQSAYAIPGIIEAIINRKIYMGGLNRILDNKIILATLTHYAPKYFAKRIEKAGLTEVREKITPPQTLPPTEKSVEIITQNPDEWVVKAPELAGGDGVYILKTLPKAKKEEVLKMIKEDPTSFAYQQLVKIARIPVAVQRKEEGFKFANLAADIRTWIFFGAGKNALPRMSHNALVRYAPQEKGKMSSIVNTSSGGGYAPFVIMDDTNDKNAIAAKDLVKPKVPVRINTELPVFVAAQMVQISRMLKAMNELLDAEETYAAEIIDQAYGLKNQLKEILAYIHPRAIEHVYKIIDTVEAKVSKNDTKEYLRFINENQAKLVDLISKYESHPQFKIVRDTLDNIRALNVDQIALTYNEEDRALDHVLLNELIATIELIQDAELKKAAMQLCRIIKKAINKGLPNCILGDQSKRNIKRSLQAFCKQAQARIKQCPKYAEFADLFNLEADVTKLTFETLYLGKRDHDKEISIATQQEMRSGNLLIDSNYVDEELQRARVEWKKTIALSNTLAPKKRAEFLKSRRKAHFGRFPRLERYQQLINSKNVTVDEFIELMDIAPYAKFNIEHFAKEQGVSIKDIFSDKLKADRISILSTQELKKLKLAKREHAGECFAKKRSAHGLYSDSDIFIWLRKELDPFTLIYTAGHELIHYQQIKHSMRAEKRAIKDGGISMAKFLNYYGNFLGSNQRTIDRIELDMGPQRKPLYGYADRVEEIRLGMRASNVEKELNKSIRKNDLAWEKSLAKYGSLFSYMMNNSTGIRVKALQEVLPALENAKNILFAQELGLIVNNNAVKAALPTANANQLRYYREEVCAAVRSPKPNWEALRVIASHQYFGVSFYRADNDEENLTLVPTVKSIAVGSSYNQTQQ